MNRLSDWLWLLALVASILMLPALAWWYSLPIGYVVRPQSHTCYTPKTLWKWNYYGGGSPMEVPDFTIYLPCGETISPFGASREI